MSVYGVCGSGSNRATGLYKLRQFCQSNGRNYHLQPRTNVCDELECSQFSLYRRDRLIKSSRLGNNKFRNCNFEVNNSKPNYYTCSKHHQPFLRPKKLSRSVLAVYSFFQRYCGSPNRWYLNIMYSSVCLIIPRRFRSGLKLCIRQYLYYMHPGICWGSVSSSDLGFYLAVAILS